MNTSQIKKFAQEARTKLLNLVAGKLESVLTQDSASLRAKAETIKKLNEEIKEIGKEALIDKVAYTWFNRFVALRFMDANDFQPLGINILSPAQGLENGSPQILADIQAGIFPENLKLDRNYINDILNGVTTSSNPDNDIYRHILIAVCNDLHRVFPFLFEKIDDYTELLLPDDLTTPFSIVADVVKGMSAEDCKEVEIIGWLYQFYVSELNVELISSKKVYKKEDLAPASQLFTPKWIVQYMVDNTLGQLLTEQFPNSRVHETLEFYIKPTDQELIPARSLKKLEEIKFFEPCVGSGHILSYAFDVFYKVYEEQGYDISDIPELIIRNNLFGVDIDPRAAQMAALVLMMKGRQRYRRFFRSVEKNNFKPNIYFYQDFPTDNKFKNATALGSLIRVSPKEADSIKVEEGSLFGEQQQELKDLYLLLSRKYDVVVTNPPYISSSRMEGSLKKYVEEAYPETKTDLFATFILRCLELSNDEGLTGYMTPFVWMFISSYEKLREIIIDKHFINNLIQLEYSGFDGATVPICTFTLRNNLIKNAKGSYIRLSDFKGSQNQAPRTLEAIQNKNCGWFYTANQMDFKKIQSIKLGYWSSNNLLEIFEKESILKDFFLPKKGMDTGRNDQFLKFWHEIKIRDFDKEIIRKNVKWVPYNKGGGFRRWYGNQEYVINWENNGKEVKTFKGSNIRAENSYFEEGLTWTRISSAYFAVRYSPPGFIFDAAGSSLFMNREGFAIELALGFLNSKVSTEILKIFNPTLTFNIGDIANLPLINIQDSILIVEKSVQISKIEWNSLETSWDFNKNELVRFIGVDIESAYNSYKDYWQLQFFNLHKNEEELNRQFIAIYGLQEELTPEVPLEDITILKEESKIENGRLVFQQKEIMAQFISYAVGCMFGRYSLDSEGLILANQGETLEDYFQKIGKEEKELRFLPDSDNVIPILEEEWFDDDIVNRAKIFIRSIWGDDVYNKNIQFVEDSLGSDLRKYFIKNFYTDHVKRYKKRPIYWMFSSPKGNFNVLIYMHRYTPDTLNFILNSYLRPFMEKVRNDMQQQEDIIITGSAAEIGTARRRQDKLKDILKDCEAYEYDILYPLAGERIAINLDDGVLVNYNKFGKAIAPVLGLNDAKTKEKVRKFDWIDIATIK